MEYRYHLQKYAGTASRHTCPACGKLRCFTLYVDDNNEPIDPSVGKCDHVSSCGYHYTPREYFRDHPDWKQDWREPRRQTYTPKPQPPKPLCTVPFEYVTRSVRLDRDSDFTAWLGTFIDPLIVEGLKDLYQIGVTKYGDVIFFQIDEQGRCRSGKIMKYGRKDGHRIKDEDCPNRINWIHNPLIRRGVLPKDWDLSQCLFGAHLLPRFPERKVILVESEKSVLVGTAFLPQYIWLSTGGKDVNLKPESLSILKGRDVTAIPDLDAIEHWTKKLKAFPYIKVVPLMRKAAEQYALPDNADVADWLVLKYGTPQTGSSGSRGSPESSEPTESKPTQEPWKEMLEMPEIAALIQDLDLELVSVSEIRT